MEAMTLSRCQSCEDAARGKRRTEGPRKKKRTEGSRKNKTCVLEGLNDPALVAKVEGLRGRLGEYRTLGRKTLEAVPGLGRELPELKAELPHGMWLPFLTEVGIKRQTFNDWKRFSNIECPKFGHSPKADSIPTPPS